jgi:hypothetical protein
LKPGEQIILLQVKMTIITWMIKSRIKAPVVRYSQ